MCFPVLGRRRNRRLERFCRFRGLDMPLVLFSQTLLPVFLSATLISILSFVSFLLCSIWVPFLGFLIVEPCLNRELCFVFTVYFFVRSYCISIPLLSPMSWAVWNLPPNSNRCFQIVLYDFQASWAVLGFSCPNGWQKTSGFVPLPSTEVLMLWGSFHL